MRSPLLVVLALAACAAPAISVSAREKHSAPPAGSAGTPRTGAAETSRLPAGTPVSAPGRVTSAQGHADGGAPAKGVPASTGAAPAPKHEGTKAPRDEGPKSCPAGMQLVDGYYCTDVEHKCLKSWYDESNRKVVCEEFEPPAKCVGEKVHKRFCIDEYAWPNVKGERPEVMNNFYQAQVKCAALGKRMCTESEWTLACEGPEMKPFPYGFVRDPKKCNGDRPWDSPNMVKVAQRDPEELARLWQGVPNGAQPQCVSDFGIYDLAGNTDDVVSSETYSTDFRGKFDSVHTGGPWYKGVRNQCRPKIYTHDEGFYYYFLGFRCCSNPDGAANDPRTPKQVKKNTKFATIESYARFTVEQMKAKLEAKKQGKCTCRAKDALCKTMCGTLLGPSARDVSLDTAGEPKAPR